MRKVKCQWCEVTDTSKSDMEFIITGKAKQVRKYYHKACYPKFLKDKEFKNKEQIEKDKLTETLKSIYGVKEIPRQVFPLIEALRNGQTVFGNKQNRGKRYKEGYSYSLIEDTFIYCMDTIHYWGSKKDFTGFMQYFKYSLAIVIDKIYLVEQKNINTKKHEQLTEMHLEKVVGEGQEYETNYKRPKKSKSDITDFLDD